MFTPNYSRNKKFRKVRVHGIASRATDVSFGVYGFKALECSMLTSKHLETIRASVSKIIKKTGRFWIRVFPHLSKTDKPSDVRMGGGKGPIEQWVAPIKPGTVVLEVDQVSPDDLKMVYRILQDKLPFKITLVKRNFLVS